MREIEKQLYLFRALNKCEYCQKELKNDNYEIDHIYPVSKGGVTSSENLAVSCKRCNANKSNKTSNFDPITGKKTVLFNPRTMKWKTHFFSINGEIRGKTQVGRSTCKLLFRRTSQFIPYDLEWKMLYPIEHKRPLYDYLNMIVQLWFFLAYLLPFKFFQIFSIFTVRIS